MTPLRARQLPYANRALDADELVTTELVPTMPVPAVEPVQPEPMPQPLSDAEDDTADE